jgi:CBS domain-containing protein
MTRRVITVPPEMSVRDLARLLATRRISGAPVVDAEGRLVGVVSEADLTRLVARTRGHEMEPSETPPFYLDAWIETHAERIPFLLEELVPQRLTVADIMSRQVICVGVDTSLQEAIDTMLTRRIHRLIVTDTAGTVVGILTTVDLLRCFQSRLPAPV